LRSIPAVGPTLPFLSYLGAFRFLRDAQRVLNEGCAKFHRRAFRVATLDGWVVILSGTPLVEELRRRPEDEFSFKDGVMSSFHLDHTLNKENDLHVEAIRDRLTRILPMLCSALVEEIEIGFKSNLTDGDEEWIAVPALEFSRKLVCQVNNRAFVGVPTCRDNSFLELAGSFRNGVAVSGAILTLVPGALRPLVRRVKSDVWRATRLLSPTVEKHRKKAAYGDDVFGKPDNVLRWLAEDRFQLAPYTIAECMLLMNLASIDPTASALASALFYLGESSSLAEALREEVKPIIEAEGWSKISIDKMHKLDSFLRENQRLNTDFITLVRKVQKDITLSDGSHLPRGTTVAVASESAHQNPDKYPDPTTFDPFRFSRMRAEAGHGPQHQFVNTSTDYLAFGYGRHACPGRFFAAIELKAVLAYVVLHYDVRLEADAQGRRPENVRVGPANLPSMTAKVLFRRRQRTCADGGVDAGQT
ncbi:cytochrome P450, partial [Daedaleopsis nitida]